MFRTKTKPSEQAQSPVCDACGGTARFRGFVPVYRQGQPGSYTSCSSSFHA